MGMVQCEEHGLLGAMLFSDSLHKRQITEGLILPGDIRRFQANVGIAKLISFWSDTKSLADAGLPLDRPLTIEEFFETEGFKCFPVCPRCVRHWLRQNNIDPQDIGLA